MLFAQSFEDEFRDWFEQGVLETALFVVVVLAVVALVLKALG